MKIVIDIFFPIISRAKYIVIGVNFFLENQIACRSFGRNQVSKDY